MAEEEEEEEQLEVGTRIRPFLEDSNKRVKPLSVPMLKSKWGVKASIIL